MSDDEQLWDPQPRGSVLAAIGIWFWRAVLGALIVALALGVGTAWRVWAVARIDDRQTADAIVVLGAAQYDGTPSTVFASRLDHAGELYREKVAPLVVTVGGKQLGDAYTEAASGRTYLSEHGVPASSIVAVEEGSDTLGSLEAVAAMLRGRSLRSVVLVSDPTHSLRARTMADDAGLTAWTSPTRQGPAVEGRESQLHGIARETGALLWYQLTNSPADFSANTGT